uniref:Serine-threonine/tyrosine-protein kinase catalytic domain-containing protein n=1 Tax=Triticum urartu TaxID=4572 RepID=A0A8R7UN91_TRIUA
MDMAIKRFTRDVQNRRYDDFFAEVSIINRLRHKNIVPLIGWSYNKGVPLLVLEFMTNGSLDQHLFHRGGNDTRQRNTNGAIRQWATRYEIIRGIATGLHYVSMSTTSTSPWCSTVTSRRATSCWTRVSRPVLVTSAWPAPSLSTGTPSPVWVAHGATSRQSTRLAARRRGRLISMRLGCSSLRLSLGYGHWLITRWWMTMTCISPIGCGAFTM